MPIPLRVHLTPDTIDPRALAGCTAVVVDVLRASTTIVAALAAGAVHVVPCLEPEDALLAREAAALPCVLGGERRGVRIDGFDLGNSPREYTPDSVGGRILAFTTTNGTRALLRCAPATAVLVGCLTNRAAVCRAAHARARPVQIVCAGTDGALCLDDVIASGAIASALLATGDFDPGDDDATRLAIAAFNAAGPAPAALAAALRQGRGGRNLVAIGLAPDIDDCAAIDTSPIVPVFDAHDGVIRTGKDAA